MADYLRFEDIKSSFRLMVVRATALMRHRRKPTYSVAD